MILKTKYCVANWKMNFNSSESENFLNLISNKDFFNNHVKVIISTSFTDIAVNTKYLTNNIEFAAQNVYFENSGPFTGEISCHMLKDFKCNWVLIGHSERREIFLEDNDLINKKLVQVIKNKMHPILCIGEMKDHRSDSKTFEVLSDQLLSAFRNIPKDKINKICIAYEPVWAIGTGKTASKKIIDETHQMIRNILLNNGYNGDDVPILYGGSVNEKNAKEISSIKNVNGFLIGGASLDVEKFYSIYNKL
jgi:triosephosphate isomerase